MRVGARIWRATVRSLAFSIVVLLGVFGFQIYLWWTLPPLSVTSLKWACSPPHALANCACLCPVVIVLGFCGFCVWEYRDFLSEMRTKAEKPDSGP